MPKHFIFINFCTTCFLTIVNDVDGMCNFNIVISHPADCNCICTHQISISGNFDVDVHFFYKSHFIISKIPVLISFTIVKEALLSLTTVLCPQFLI